MLTRLSKITRLSHSVFFLVLVCVCSQLSGCAGARPSASSWPSHQRATEQWQLLKSGQDIFESEVLVMDPVDGQRPLWNYEALGDPPRTIKVGHAYPLKFREGRPRRPEIRRTFTWLHIWQGGVDLKGDSPPPTRTIDLSAGGTSLKVEQPGYWTYMCQCSYEYMGESLTVPCRWTNFFSR